MTFYILGKFFLCKLQNLILSYFLSREYFVLWLSIRLKEVLCLKSLGFPIKPEMTSHMLVNIYQQTLLQVFPNTNFLKYFQFVLPLLQEQKWLYLDRRVTQSVYYRHERQRLLDAHLTCDTVLRSGFFTQELQNTMLNNYSLTQPIPT